MLYSCTVSIKLIKVYITSDAVPFRNRERITFDHLVSMKKLNEKAVVRVLRDSQEIELSITLQPVSFIYILGPLFLRCLLHTNQIMYSPVSNTNELLYVYSHHIELAMDTFVMCSSFSLHAT